MQRRLFCDTRPQVHPDATSSLKRLRLSYPNCLCFIAPPLRRCILDAMFDERFRLKPAFLHNERALQRRLR